MSYQVYLSGEIHTDWRDEIRRGAEAAGLDLQALGRVVRHTDALTGGPGAIMVREDMSDLQPDHWLYEAFTHNRGLGEKDLSLALGLGATISLFADVVVASRTSRRPSENASSKRRRASASATERR